MMKKALLGVAIMAASSTVAANDFFNGRLTAMSGAGFVTGGFTDGVLLNPSLGASYGPSDDFGMSFNAGLFATDKDDLIDALDDMVDFLDELDERSNQTFTQADADRLIELLEATDDRTVYLGVGGSLLVAIPNRFASAALYGKARLAVSITPSIDSDDFALIESSIGDEFDTDDLNSSINARGTLVTEVGLALSRQVYTTESSRLLVGVTPKKVTVETIVYSAQVSDFDEDDLDADDYTLKGTLTTFDLGATYIDGKMRYGLVLRDVIGKDFATVEVDGDKFSIKPQATAAVGHDRGWFKAEIAMDLNAVPNFALGGDVQLLRAGVEFNAWRWAQLRAGFQRDLKDSLEDTVSLGLGLSPFNVLNLDLAVTAGDNNTYGGSLQLGMRF